MAISHSLLCSGNLGIVVKGTERGLIIEGTGIRKITTFDSSSPHRPLENEFVVITEITSDIRPNDPDSGFCCCKVRPLKSSEITPAILESDNNVRLCKNQHSCSFELQPIFRLVDVQGNTEGGIARLKVAYRLTARDKSRGRHMGEMIGSWGEPQSFPLNPRPYCQETDSQLFFFSRNYGNDSEGNPLLLSSTATASSTGRKLWDSKIFNQPVQGPTEAVNQVIDMLRKQG